MPDYSTKQTSPAARRSLGTRLRLRGAQLLGIVRTRVLDPLRKSGPVVAEILPVAERAARFLARLNPNNPKLLARSAALSLKVGRNASAFSSINTALALEPNDASLQGALIRGLVSLGHFAEGEESASRALQTWPDNVSILELRGECRAAQANFSGAKEDMEKIAAVCEAADDQEKQRLEFFRSGGHALLRVGRTESAEDVLRAGLAQYPEHPTLKHLLALCYAAQGRRTEAIALWREQLVRDPENETAAAALVFHLVRWSGGRKGVVGGGRGNVLLVNALTPGDSMSDIVLALSSGDREGALRSWREQRAQILPKDVPSYSKMLANLFRLLRQLDQPALLVAIGDEEDLIVNNPAPSFPQRQAIRLYIRTLVDMHETEKARAILTDERYFQPETEDDQASLAELLFAERRLDESLATARAAASQFPQSFRAHRMVARGLAGKRDHAAVGEYIESVHARGLLNGVQLGKIATLAGQNTLAERLFGESLNPRDAETIKAYTDFLQRTGRWQNILELGARYNTVFKTDWYLRTTLDEVQNLARTLEFPPEDDDDDGNALIGVYEEVLRRAPTTRISDGPLRVAMVIGTLGPGGAERQCRILCSELAHQIERGRIAEVKVFVGNLFQSDRDSFHQEGIEKTGASVVQYQERSERLNASDVVEDETMAQLLMALQPAIRCQQVLQLYKHLRDFKPDIVHAWLDNAIYAAGLSTALLPNARLVGRWGSLPPTVQRVSSAQEHEQASALREAYGSLMRLAKVQFYSNARLTADTYAEWIGVPSSDILVVKNGIDFSNLTRDAAARARIRGDLGIPQDAAVIGTTIRLGSEKRPFMWLDIAEKVAAKCDNAAFIIVGDGPLLEDVQAKVKELAHAKVHIVGRQSNVSDWYSAMDVNLMTSSVEGLSNTILESSYMGLPVVAYDVGGMSEAVESGQTGFLLEEADVDGMADVLVRLVTEPELRKAIGEKGHAFVAESFDPIKMCDSVLAIYDELLKR
jgi:glycosyltransferase involved in cell wall biosynthesis/Flp pilus assembly protein TadD